MPPNAMDIMSGLTALIQGLQQNIARGKAEEMQALQMFAGMPGMQLAPAPNATPQNVFKRLLGLPSYQPGPGGTPVVPLGGTAFTVQQAPSARDFLQQLLGGQADTGAGTLSSPLGAEGNAMAAPSVASGSMAGRPQGVAGLGRLFGFTPEEITRDPFIQQYVTTPGTPRGKIVERLRDMRKEQQEQRSVEAKLQGDVKETVARAYHGVTDQAGLDAANRALAQEAWMPPSALQSLPQHYSPERVQQMIQFGTAVRDLTEPGRQIAVAKVVEPYKTAEGLRRLKAEGRIKTAEEVRQRQILDPMQTQQAVEQRRQLIPLEQDAYEQRLRADAPYKLEQAQAQGENAGNRAYDAAIARNRAELENAPLEAGVAEKISTLNTLVRFSNDISQLRQNNFTGKIAGREGAIREFTGNISNDEVEFRRLITDSVDLLGRARSGGAITEREEVRFAQMLPAVTDPPNVFIAKMDGFGRAVQTMRDEKLRLAVTPRGKLQETMPRITPHAPAAPPLPAAVPGAPKYPTPRQRQGANLAPASPMPEPPPMSYEQAVAHLMRESGLTRAQAEAELGNAQQIAPSGSAISGTPPVSSAPAPVAPPERSTVSSADIDATMASQNAKRQAQGLRPLTRDEVIAAFQAKGWRVQ